jgi:hypothetical protein
VKPAALIVNGYHVKANNSIHIVTTSDVSAAVKMAIAFPDGGLGIAAKVALGLVGAIWWTSAPGADEAR